MLLCRSYPVPDNEALRVRDLERSGIWHTPPEPVYDSVVALAATIFDTRICVISFLSDRRQWFKASIGLEDEEVGREDAFCAYTIMSPDLLLVADAREDRRFRSYPAVTGALAIRFYAGVPIASPDGRLIGTLCIADPRAGLAFDRTRQACLTHLAAIVQHQLGLRNAAGRRRTERHPYCAECVVGGYGKRPRPAQMVDVSRGGALIEVESSGFVRGDEVIVTVGALAIAASVAWHDGCLVGLSFLGPLTYERLLLIRDQAPARSAGDQPGGG